MRVCEENSLRHGMTHSFQRSALPSECFRIGLSDTRSLGSVLANGIIATVRVRVEKPRSFKVLRIVVNLAIDWYQGGKGGSVWIAQWSSNGISYLHTCSESLRRSPRQERQEPISWRSIRRECEELYLRRASNSFGAWWVARGGNYLGCMR